MSDLVTRINRIRFYVQAIFIMACVALVIALTIFVMSGCQTVGNKAQFDRTKSALEGGQPVLVNIQDDTLVGTATGTSSSGFINSTLDGTTAMYGNSPPRNLSFLFHPDGTRQINLAGASDALLEGLEYDPSTGVLRVARFQTLTSTVVSAFDPSIASVTSWWKTLTAAQRDTRISELKARAELGDTLATTVLGIVTGIPLP
jgi:hypothetical protein